MIFISKDEGFDFGSLLKKKEKKKEEQKRIDEFEPEFDFQEKEPEMKIPLPNETTDQYGVPVPDAIIRESKSVIPEVIREHPIVKDFTAMMDKEVAKAEVELNKDAIEFIAKEGSLAFTDLVHSNELAISIVEKIESLEKNYDLAFMQKLITIKNVLNYTQSSWSFGVCKEILDGISIRGSQKKIAYGLISTIKKMAKLG